MIRPCGSLFSLLLLLGPMVACRPESPEARVQAAFDACVKGIEAKDPAAVIERLSPRFTGPEGMDRDQARLALLGHLRGQKLGITVLESRIEVKGARAEQAVDIFITGRGESQILPDDSTRKSFRLRWELVGDDWKLKDLAEIHG